MKQISIQDIIKSNQLFEIYNDEWASSDAAKYFFENILDKHNVDTDNDYNPIVNKISDAIYELKYRDDEKSNIVRYSIKLIFTLIESDKMCHISWYDKTRIKEDCAKDIPDTLKESAAIKWLESIESLSDKEDAHIMADEVLLSVIKQYVPNADEIIDKFVSIDKWYS